MPDKKGNPVGWFEIYVNDMSRAKKFYESVFQIQLEHLSTPSAVEQEMEMWAFGSDFSSYGAPGALVKMDGVPAGAPGGVIVYFSCMDCAQEAARAGEAGGVVLQKKTSIGDYGYMALVKDSEGNVIGLHSME